MLSIEKIIKEGNLIKEFYEFQKANINLPVILYGAGAGVQWFIKLMKKYDITITSIIDGKYSYTDKGCIEGIDVQSLGWIEEQYNEIIIVISAPAHRNEIIYKIKQSKLKEHVFSFDPTLEILQGVGYEERKNYYLDKQEELFELWKKLNDDFSRKTFENILRGALTSNCDFYQGIANTTQYFPDIIMSQINSSETFVDVGAYTGDSISEFINAVQGKWHKIFAFEPDSNNYKIAKKNYNDERICLFKKGVGRKNETLFLLNENKGKDEGAHVVDNADIASELMKVVKLDDVISEKVTYIKMDIEGMEMDALLGAKKLIKSYRPKLAVSVYHKMEDLLLISHFIESMDLEYKLYLRHYWSCSGTDTVLFAI